LIGAFTFAKGKSNDDLDCRLPWLLCSNRQSDRRQFRTFRLFVPKRWIGNFFMLNFARPAAWIVALIILAVIIVAIPFAERWKFSH
jgi:uncharacterized membrane protein